MPPTGAFVDERSCADPGGLARAATRPRDVHGSSFRTTRAASGSQGRFPLARSDRRSPLAPAMRTPIDRSWPSPCWGPRRSRSEMEVGPYLNLGKRRSKGRCRVNVQRRPRPRAWFGRLHLPKQVADLRTAPSRRQPRRATPGRWPSAKEIVAPTLPERAGRLPPTAGRD